MGMFDFVGDVLGAYSSHREAEMSRDWNESEAQKKRDWDERMANTQYQRTIQDLNAAGLSPMLAYSKGATSMPSGATASSSAMGQGLRLGETASKIAASELAREQVDVAKSTQIVNEASADKLRAEAENVRQDTENKRLYPGMNEAQINELIARAGQHGASAGQLKALMDEIRQEINIKKPQERFSTEEPEKAKWLNPIRDSLKTIFEGIGLLRGTSAMPNVTKVQRAKR